MSTLDVQVAAQGFMSIPASTYPQVSNGAQNALVGGEVVGVVDATDLGNGAFRLGPTLIRGMRGSPTTVHAAGETFAAAPDVDSTTKVAVAAEYEGRTVYVQVLSPGQVVGDSVELSCVVAKPKPPYVTSLPQWITEPPIGSADGTNKVFTLSYAPIQGSLAITGATGSGGFMVSGTTLTFTNPPAAGSSISAQYQYTPA